jgi:hypothetical protein
MAVAGVTGMSWQIVAYVGLAVLAIAGVSFITCLIFVIREDSIDPKSR